MPDPTRRALLHQAGTALLGAGAFTLAGCTTKEARPPGSAAASSGAAQGRQGPVRLGSPPPVVSVGGTPAEQARAVSGALFAASRAAVVAVGQDPQALAAAASTAAALGIPCLVAGDGLETELRRLRVETVFTVPSPTAPSLGSVTVRPTPASAEELSLSTGSPAIAKSVPAATLDAAVAALSRDSDPAVFLTVTDAPAPESATSPPATTGSAASTPSSAAPREPIPGLPVRGLPAPPALALWPAASEGAPGGAGIAALATVRAAGVPLARATGADPRADHRVVTALREHPDASVLALGDAFGGPVVVGARLRTARSARELPGGGGLLPFPARRMVALYGHPATGALGMLGERSLERTIERAQQLAKTYAALSDVPVIPAFEIIATVATGSAGPDGTYSKKTALAELEPWVDAAEQAGIYVVLDLQPGREDFLTQAKIYEPLLRRPWVGLALDPEWRLGPNEVHLRQIGSVAASEINEVSAWLAGVVREHDLPPKVLTLHQFQQRMIRERATLDLSHDELQVLVHVDGSGHQGAKQETWSAIRQGLPAEVFLGWKNFVDEDFPMLTEEQTMRRVRPTPSFISYQ